MPKSDSCQDRLTEKGLRRGRIIAFVAVLVSGCSTPGPVEPIAAARGANCAALWRFDRLDRIGGMPVTSEGTPSLIRTPAGPAVKLDGVDDALRIACHPLAGARAFTFEAVFRPDGGAFAQRWFHLAQAPEDGRRAPEAFKDTPRIMFEIRVEGNDWYLDAFAFGPGYRQTLVLPQKRHPIGRWYHVAQTFDGTTYRSYVDGALEGEAKIAFVPQGPGATSVGTRINGVNYFNGAVYAARFTPRARAPREFLHLQDRLNGAPR